MEPLFMYKDLLLYPNAGGYKKFLLTGSMVYSILQYFVI